MLSLIKRKILIVAMASAISTCVYADNPPAANPAPAPTDEQRITKLEQQVSDLEQQNKQISGQLSELSHDLDLLNQQQRDFYQDLNQRIQRVSNLANAGGMSDTSDVPNVLAPAKPKAGDTTDDLQAKEQATYQAAFDLLIQKKWDDAKTAFLAYLNDYPNGQYVADTHYWLGEIYGFEEDAPHAISEFQTVVQQYPTSIKVSDAKLKLANWLVKTGHPDDASHYYQQIMKDHPNSAAATLAEAALKQITPVTT